MSEPREPRDLRDLVGDDVDPEELQRLRRVHELLVASGPPPELSPGLERAPSSAPRERREGLAWFLPQRRLGTAFAIVVAIAAAAFAAGYFVGRDEFDAHYSLRMRGTALAPNATARIEVARPDRGGNVPMLVHVRGLPRLPARGYYTLYVLRNGKPVVPCGTFNISGRATVAFTVPYRLTPSEEMVVARERAGGKHPGPIVMTTTDV